MEGQREAVLKKKAAAKKATKTAVANVAIPATPTSNPTPAADNRTTATSSTPTAPSAPIGHAAVAFTPPVLDSNDSQYNFFRA